MAEEQEEEQRTTSASPSGHSIFAVDNVVIFVVAELIAAPLCFAGGDHFVKQEWLSAIFGYGVGVPIGAVGFTFPFWKRRVSTALRDWLWNVSQWLAPVAIVAAMTFIEGPVVYRNIIQPLPAKTGPTAGDIAKAVVHELPSGTSSKPPQDIFDLITSLRSQLDGANQKLTEETDELTATTQELKIARHPPSNPANVHWGWWNPPVNSGSYNFGLNSYSLLNQPSLIGGTPTNTTVLFLSFDRPVNSDDLSLAATGSLPSWQVTERVNDRIAVIWIQGQVLSQNLKIEVHK
jgi:hypothetical protein